MKKGNVKNKLKKRIMMLAAMGASAVTAQATDPGTDIPTTTADADSVVRGTETIATALPYSDESTCAAIIQNPTFKQIFKPGSEHSTHIFELLASYKANDDEAKPRIFKQLSTIIVTDLVDEYFLKSLRFLWDDDDFSFTAPQRMQLITTLTQKVSTLTEDYSRNHNTVLHLLCKHINEKFLYGQFASPEDEMSAKKELAALRTSMPSVESLISFLQSISITQQELTAPWNLEMARERMSGQYHELMIPYCHDDGELTMFEILKSYELGAHFLGMPSIRKIESRLVAHGMTFSSKGFYVHDATHYMFAMYGENKQVLSDLLIAINKIVNPVKQATMLSFVFAFYHEVFSTHIMKILRKNPDSPVSAQFLTKAVLANDSMSPALTDIDMYELLQTLGFSFSFEHPLTDHHILNTGKYKAEISAAWMSIAKDFDAQFPGALVGLVNPDDLDEIVGPIMCRRP